mmetsp:Transcript_5599/g.8178  ORF Transcript_5599/g.8178 Transcript_5599/m.8178 type:complete len:147 (-) Transcript_5599:423-863(-)
MVMDDADEDCEDDACAHTTVYAAAKNKTMMTHAAATIDVNVAPMTITPVMTASEEIVGKANANANAKKKCPSSLAHPDDRNHVNTLHCFVREECIEVFQANKADVAASRKGRRMPIALNRVGLRCKFCTNVHHNPCSSSSSSIEAI